MSSVLELKVTGELPKRQSVPVVVSVRADAAGNARTVERILRLR